MIFVRVRQNAPYCAAGWQDSERSYFAKMRSNLITLPRRRSHRLLRSLRPAAFKQGEPRRARRQYLKERFAERHCGTCITNHCTQKPKKKPIRIFHANCNKYEPPAPPCRCARFAVILPIFQERASRSSWVYGQ